MDTFLSRRETLAGFAAVAVTAAMPAHAATAPSSAATLLDRLAWRLLDLASVNGAPVDQLICTKFPSYLARHPRKVVWLVHQHRQAYDQYGTPLSDFVNVPAHQSVRDAIFRMDGRGLGEARARFTISRNVSARLRRFNGLDSAPLYPPSRFAAALDSTTAVAR